MDRRFKAILIIGLFIRLVLAPLTQHPDVIDNLNWGKNLVSEGFYGFYRRDIPDAGPPNYPPLYYFLNYGNQLLYESTKGVLWKANLAIPVFPSGLYLWFESQAGNIFFNKLPAIVADIGIAYLLFKIVGLFKNKKIAEKTALLYLILPPSWYLSAVWGQTDSLYILFILAGLYAFFKKNWTLMAISYFLSLLIKPTGIFVAPLFGYFYFRNFNIRHFFYTILISLVIIILFALPFLEQFTLRDIVDLYKNNIREVTGYLTANSFNIWSLFYGLKPVSDSIKLAGVYAYKWGEALYLLLLLFILTRLKAKSFVAAMLSFATLSLGAYLLMTKMHERYYYLAYIFIAVVSGLDKKLKNIFYITSGMFIINLYHFWWMPKFETIVTILSQNIVEKTLVIVNIFIFLYLCKSLLSANLKEKDLKT